MIILLIALYIVMWVITSVALSRWTKSTAPGWVAVGLLWPFVIVTIPFLLLILAVEEIVKKYGFREE
jgi:hypothetical protein